MLNIIANITGIGKIYGKEVMKGGIRYMKTDRLLVDFKLARSRFKIRDLLNTNNVLGKYASDSTII